MGWVRGKLIGKGSYGSIYIAIPTVPGWPLLAAKTSLVRDSLSLQKENRILQRLIGCEEIIQWCGSCLRIENGISTYNLLMEYAPGGTLIDLIIKYGGKIPENDVRIYTEMILKGMCFIHIHGMVHCDLKPENILVFPSLSAHDHLSRLKIADFGLAKELGEDGCFGSNFRGTPLYMSPESVKERLIEPALDIWSLGCLVVEMITGKPAWGCLDMEDLYVCLAENRTPVIPDNVSNQGKDFLRKCFDRDYKKRWTAEMLLNHPFIADMEEPSLDDEFIRSILEVLPL